MARNRDPLTLHELAELREADSRDAIRRGLIRLADHLEDPLVVVEEVRANDGGTARLVVFTAEDGGTARQLYALVGRDGNLRVGPVDPLGAAATLHLDGFEPTHHGLVSVAVTRRHRFLGEAQDVWVVVRGDSQDRDHRGDALAYHAVLITSDGRPLLSPSREDFPQQGPATRWQAGNADRLPQALLQWNLQVATGTDPFEPLPAEAMEAIREAEAHPSGRLEALAWAHKLLAVATAGRVHLPLVDGQPGLTLGDWVRALALVPLGRPRGVAGTDGRELVAFAYERELQEAWCQTLPSFPSALAFLPDRVDPSDAGDWPDLLATLEDGRLLRLRRLPPRNLLDVWNRLWHKLELGSLESRHQALLGAREADPEWRATLWIGLLVQLEPKAGRLSAAGRSRWHKRLVKALRNEAAPRVLERVAEMLVERTAALLPGDSPIPTACDLLLGVLYDTYTTNLQIRLQDHVDQGIRGLQPSALRFADPRLQELVDRAENTRQKVWRDRSRQGRDPQTAIRLAEFGLERWGSAYLLADSRRLPSLTDRVWTGLACLGDRREGSYLAAASISDLAIHRLDEDRLAEAKSVARHTFKDEGIQALATLPAATVDGLLVAGASGRLYQFGFEPGERGLSKLGTWQPSGDLGSAWALAALPSPDGAFAIAAAYNLHRRSLLVFLTLTQGRLTEVSRTPLPLVRARHLDLVRTGSEHLLLAGSVHGAPTAVFALDQRGQAGEPRWFRVLRSGTSAARFAGGDGTFVVGERSGLLWCGRSVRQGRVEDLMWIFDLGSAARAIEAVEIHGKPHVLAGSENGWLVLLDVADGRRVWEQSFSQPIRAIRALSGASGPGVAVALQGGRVAVLTAGHDRSEALAEVRGYLRQLAESEGFDPEADWPPSAECSRAFFLLEQRGEPFAETFGASRFRRTRARLVRYLAQEIAPRGEPEHLNDLLAAFSVLELMLLLSYRPQKNSAWEDLVWREVKSCPDREGAEPEGTSPRGAAAAVAFLQRFAQREPGLDAIRRVTPPSRLLEVPWVRLEFARHLLAAAQQATARLQPGPSLLAQSIKCLLELPPSLVDACAQVLRAESRPAQEFNALASVLDALSRGESPRTADLSTVVTGLRRGSSNHPVVRLIAAVFAFQEGCLEWLDESWGEHRDRVLARLRELLAAAHDPVHNNLPTDALAVDLRHLLGEEAPADQVRLSEQLRWYEQLRRRLVSPPRGRDGAGEEPWREIFSRIHVSIREQFDRITRLETVRLLKVVRPWVELLESKRDETNRLVLRLRLVPEGSRQLEDVSILVNAEGAASLKASTGTCDRRDLLTYPEGASNWEAVLSGYVDPQQKTVEVRTEIIDGARYRHEDVWTFPVPPPTFQTSSHPFLTSLPRTFRSFAQDVLKSRAPVVLAVLDADMSFESFAATWLQQSGGRLVDLDAALREYGRGRRYDAQPLTLQLIENQVLEEATPRTRARARTKSAPPSRTDSPVLVAPTREVIQRLVDGEAPGMLEGLAAWLRQRAEAADTRRLVVAVSSAHACRLRSLGLGAVEEIAAHRLWLAEERGSKGSGSLREEAEELLIKEEGLSPATARRRLDELAWDPRWLLRWLRWSRSERERRDGVGPFFALPEQEELLRAELGGLSPHDLVCTLVACRAATSLDLRQVVPGQIAVENYSSTTRSGPSKLLQEAGTPFAERSLTALRSDLQPKSKVRVEGFGLVGAPEAMDSNLLGLASYPQKALREEGLARLARLGFGTYVGGIFRTGPPFRSFIQRLYEQSRAAESESRDAVVYRELKGAQGSPLDSLSLKEMSAVPRADLQRLLPKATAHDVRLLLRIARLYTAADDDDPEDLLAALLRAPVARVLSQRADATDHALSKLPFPVFAISSQEPQTEFDSHPAEYVAWLQETDPLSTELGSQALEKVEQERQVERAARIRAARAEARGERPEVADVQRPRPPKLFLLGPGADEIPFDPRRMVAVVRSHDLCHAAWDGDLQAGVRRRTRGQLRLTARSPFQTAGALPSNSPLFVGRKEELSFIKAHSRSASVLIIGSRRVGKTSLLNQVLGWARNQPDLAPIYVDLQGCYSRKEFFTRWRKQLRHATAPEVARAGTDLEEVFQRLLHSGRLPIVLLNEIDGLALHDKPFIETLRGYNDQELARFVMVGYSAIGQLENPTSPFYHFTQGDRFGGKAIALTALSPDAAEELLRLLSDSDVGIEWASEDDRRRSIALCLERSYRIPWVLQRYGQLLVEHLEKERRVMLSFDDVRFVVGREGQVVWQYFDSIDYTTLGFTAKTRALRPGFKLLLFALARGRYFLGGKRAPILDPHLDDRSPLQADLGFTVGEAQEVLEETLDQLLIGPEKIAVSRWIESLNLEETIRLLTLTLALEPDPKENGRYGFLLHILPKELDLQRDRFGGTLDQGIIDLAIELLRQLRTEAEELR